MRILCPNCHAVYEVGPLIKNAVLVCHRCNTEFTPDDRPFSPDEEKKEVSEKLPLFDTSPAENKAEVKESGQTDMQEADPGSHVYIEQEAPQPIIPGNELGEEFKEEPSQEKNEAPAIAEEPVPSIPRRKKSRIWPWLVMMLMLIGGGGFYFKQDVWLAHPWVRSLLINSKIDVPLLNEDWNIVSDSVQGQWITRQDNSRILLIEGRVENQLYCSMSPPKILVRFYMPGSDKIVSEQLMQITEPPTLEKIQQAPFSAPPIDTVPVESRGSRSFMLVFEELPADANNFELSPVAMPR